MLRKCTVINGRVVEPRPRGRGSRRIDPIDGPEYDLDYDIVVVRPGLRRPHPADPRPGRRGGRASRPSKRPSTCATRCCNCLDVAESTTDVERRRRALTFVFVGGGYAGVEALAELEDLARDATEYYQNITPRDLRFVLVEAIGPDPARGRPGHGRVHASCSCPSATSTSG